MHDESVTIEQQTISDGGRNGPQPPQVAGGAPQLTPFSLYADSGCLNPRPTFRLRDPEGPPFNAHMSRYVTPRPTLTFRNPVGLPAAFFMDGYSVNPRPTFRLRDPAGLPAAFFMDGYSVNPRPTFRLRDPAGPPVNFNMGGCVNARPTFRFGDPAGPPGDFRISGCLNQRPTFRFRDPGGPPASLNIGGNRPPLEGSGAAIGPSQEIQNPSCSSPSLRAPHGPFSGSSRPGSIPQLRGPSGANPQGGLNTGNRSPGYSFGPREVGGHSHGLNKDVWRLPGPPRYQGDELLVPRDRRNYSGCSGDFSAPKNKGYNFPKSNSGRDSNSGTNNWRDSNSGPSGQRNPNSGPTNQKEASGPRNNPQGPRNQQSSRDQGDKGGQNRRSKNRRSFRRSRGSGNQQPGPRNSKELPPLFRGIGGSPPIRTVAPGSEGEFSSGVPLPPFRGPGSPMLKHRDPPAQSSPLRRAGGSTPGAKCADGYARILRANEPPSFSKTTMEEEWPSLDSLSVSPSKNAQRAGAGRPINQEPPQSTAGCSTPYGPQQPPIVTPSNISRQHRSRRSNSSQPKLLSTGGVPSRSRRSHSSSRANAVNMVSPGSRRPHTAPGSFALPPIADDQEWPGLPSAEKETIWPAPKVTPPHAACGQAPNSAQLEESSSEFYNNATSILNKSFTSISLSRTDHQSSLPGDEQEIMSPLLERLLCTPAKSTLTRATSEEHLHSSGKKLAKKQEAVAIAKIFEPDAGFPLRRSASLPASLHAQPETVKEEPGSCNLPYQLERIEEEPESQDTTEPTSAEESQTANDQSSGHLPINHATKEDTQPRPKDNVDEGSDMSRVVYVKDLRRGIHADEVAEFFGERFGPLKATHVFSDCYAKNQMDRRPQGFILFEKRADAEKAVFELGGKGGHIRLIEEPPIDDHNVFIKNIPITVTEKDFAKTFEEFGPVISVGLISGGRNEEDKPTLIGFARYRKGFPHCASEAIRHFHGKKLEGATTPMAARLAFMPVISLRGRNLGNAALLEAQRKRQLSWRHNQQIMQQNHQEDIGGPNAGPNIGGNKPHPGPSSFSPDFQQKQKFLRKRKEEQPKKRLCKKCGKPGCKGKKKCLATKPFFMAMPPEYSNPPQQAIDVRWVYEYVPPFTASLVPYLTFRELPPLRGTLREDGIFYGEMHFYRMPHTDSLFSKFTLYSKKVPIMMMDDKNKPARVVYEERGESVLAQTVLDFRDPGRMKPIHPSKERIILWSDVIAPGKPFNLDIEKLEAHLKLRYNDLLDDPDQIGFCERLGLVSRAKQRILAARNGKNNLEQAAKTADGSIQLSPELVTAVDVQEGKDDPPKSSEDLDSKEASGGLEEGTLTDDSDTESDGTDKEADNDASEDESGSDTELGSQTGSYSENESRSQDGSFCKTDSKESSDTEESGKNESNGTDETRQSDENLPKDQDSDEEEVGASLNVEEFLEDSGGSSEEDSADEDEESKPCDAEDFRGKDHCEHGSDFQEEDSHHEKEGEVNNEVEKNFDEQTTAEALKEGECDKEGVVDAEANHQDSGTKLSHGEDDAETKEEYFAKYNSKDFLEISRPKVVKEWKAMHPDIFEISQTKNSEELGEENGNEQGAEEEINLMNGKPKFDGSKKKGNEGFQKNMLKACGDQTDSDQFKEEKWDENWKDTTTYQEEVVEKNFLENVQGGKTEDPMIDKDAQKREKYLHKIKGDKDQVEKASELLEEDQKEAKEKDMNKKEHQVTSINQADLGKAEQKLSSGIFKEDRETEPVPAITQELTTEDDDYWDQGLQWL